MFAAPIFRAAGETRTRPPSIGPVEWKAHSFAVFVFPNFVDVLRRFRCAWSNGFPNVLGGTCVNDRPPVVPYLVS